MRAAVVLRPKVGTKPQADTGTRDAVADLADWLTDTEYQTTTGVAGETLVAVKKALLEEDSSYVRRAYFLVSHLRNRNSYTLGQDIPANHVECHREFRQVIECLQDRLLEKMEAVRWR